MHTGSGLRAGREGQGGREERRGRDVNANTEKQIHGSVYVRVCLFACVTVAVDVRV